MGWVLGWRGEEGKPLFLQVGGRFCWKEGRNGRSKDGLELKKREERARADLFFPSLPFLLPSFPPTEWPADPSSTSSPSPEVRLHPTLVSPTPLQPEPDLSFLPSNRGFRIPSSPCRPHRAHQARCRRSGSQFVLFSSSSSPPRSLLVELTSSLVAVPQSPWLRTRGRLTPSLPTPESRPLLSLGELVEPSLVSPVLEDPEPTELDR